jgi:hypothetical protein
MALTMLSPSYMPRSGLGENGAIRGAHYFLWAMRALAACDAPKGVFDRQPIDCVGIVFIRPFFGYSTALVGGVCNRFKHSKKPEIPPQSSGGPFLSPPMKRG